MIESFITYYLYLKPKNLRKNDINEISILYYVGWQWPILHFCNGVVGSLIEYTCTFWSLLPVLPVVCVFTSNEQIQFFSVLNTKVFSVYVVLLAYLLTGWWHVVHQAVRNTISMISINISLKIRLLNEIWKLGNPCW